MKTIDCDYLVVGSGIAGLMSAIHLAEGGATRILIVTKAGVEDSNSSKAQGGIASVMEPTDSFDAHSTTCGPSASTPTASSC